MTQLYIYVYPFSNFNSESFFISIYTHFWGFPGGSVDKESASNAGDTGEMDSIPGSGRSLGEGNGNPLQYSCLGNPMDRGA